jgi:hypothetical protein
MCARPDKGAGVFVENLFVKLSRIAATLLLFAALGLSPRPATAAELIMFEDVGCPWCARFNRDIAPIYPKTAEGKRAPLRRVGINDKLPSDIAFIQVERLTPLFVLVDQGREIGRIRGYPGEDHFYGLLSGLIKKLGPP